MQIAPLPLNEEQRLQALKNYNLLDTDAEPVFDHMVQLASYICQTPIAAISLVDEKRQWFKASIGLAARQTSRDVAFCAHTILQDGVMVVPDAKLDERFHDNPLVTSGPEIRFYAGVPLATPEGMHLGTLCVIDTVRRDLSPEQLSAIKTLGDSIMAHLDLRQAHKQTRQYVADLQLAATIFDSASEAMLVTDPDNRIITVNPAFCSTTGYTLDEVVGRNPKFLSSGRQSKEFYQGMWQSLSDTGHWAGELWNRRKNGDDYAEWLSINVIWSSDTGKRLHVAIFSDITEKKRAQELIWSHAHLDPLTKLPNRRLFADRLEQEIKRADRESLPLALLYLDLDHFKEVNDSRGHDAGDALLVEVATRLRAALRNSDTVARLGGDEFAVILPELTDTDKTRQIAQNLLDNLAAPFLLSSGEVTISGSIGGAFYPHDASNVETLLKHADQAMFDAKHAGRNRYVFFEKPV